MRKLPLRNLELKRLAAGAAPLISEDVFTSLDPDAPTIIAVALLEGKSARVKEWDASDSLRRNVYREVHRLRKEYGKAKTDISISSVHIDGFLTVYLSSISQIIQDAFAS